MKIVKFPINYTHTQHCIRSVWRRKKTKVITFKITYVSSTFRCKRKHFIGYVKIFNMKQNYKPYEYVNIYI